MLAKLALCAGLIATGSAFASTVPFTVDPMGGLVAGGSCTTTVSGAGLVSGELLGGGSESQLLPQIISFDVEVTSLPTIDVVSGPDDVTRIDPFLTPIAPLGGPGPTVGSTGSQIDIGQADVVGNGLRSLPVPLPGAGMMAMVGLAAVAGTSRRRRF